MTTLDWLVIAGYMVGMLAIGAYYSQQNDTSEEYLLGGRNLNFMSVGLSLFAALLSTVSYLAIPGEVIDHGPMIFFDVLTYPIVYWIVGWFVIPRFMALRVTSAYEVIESRFGLGMRLLGSTLFLSMRLIWLGVIVYVTSSQILVPLLELPQQSTPLVCVVMGIVTVIYTSMGGLRAVVVTDAIQSIILLLGAVLTVVIVSMSLGGVASWIPDSWPTHWDSLEFGFRSGARVTVGLACLNGLLWWICTTSADQMAIQRYLSTRDTRAARGALAVSLVTTAISYSVLAMVGLAVAEYFRVNPVKLSTGGDSATNIDAMFPKFIATSFPPAAAGLVIAGLLAAAMSSLSSGISSCGSIVAVDFLDRLGRQVVTEVAHLRRTRLISWGIGLVSVIASTLVGFVDGSILEVCYKAVNLLIAPLFLLVFMALCVPRATHIGALASVIVSSVVSVGVAYGGWFDLSFMWILPMSLAAGGVAGIIGSIIPTSYQGSAHLR